MVTHFQSFCTKLQNGESLTPEEASCLAQGLMDAAIPQSDKLCALRALHEKGESVDEVSAFAETFREVALKPDLGAFPARALDVCGTGGDGAGTFNISTAVGFLVASAGVPVIKHGNRSITSKCGSADILEALGFKLSPESSYLKESLEALNFVFLFAPQFHPAFKEIAPVRKQLAAEGKRSIFNILGPLINPASPAYQLMGVFCETWLTRMAGALNTLGLKRGLVVHCKIGETLGLDELTACGINHACGAGDLDEQRVNIDLCALGFDRSSFDDLKGGDLTVNLELLHKLARNEAPTGLTDTVLLNAGVGLWVAKRSRTLGEGVQLARETLEHGGFRTWLDRVSTFHQP